MVIFVTGTDTGVGKTVVCALLGQALQQGVAEHGRDRGQQGGGWACYFKPVQTGVENEDALEVSRFSSIDVAPTLYHYALAASPDQAQAQQPERPAVDVEEVRAQVQALQSRYRWVLCEGAGGLYVPLNRQGHTWLDLLVAINAHIFVVARSSLGTLNHTALSLKALQMRGLEVRGVVVSGSRHEANMESLRRMHNHTPFFALPQLSLEDPGGEEVRRWGRSVWEVCGGAVMAYGEEQAERQHEIERMDQDHTWHPFTQHDVSPPPVWVQRARGSRWILRDQSEMWDGISSWWVSLLGHGRRELAECLAAGHQHLDHVLYGGVAHEQAALFAAQILQLAQLKTERPFGRVFFSDNGSTAVEVALKMAYGYSMRRRQLARDARFYAVAGGYHGDTFGGMSVSAKTHYHRAFKDLFMPCSYVMPDLTHPHPTIPHPHPSLDESLKRLDEVFALEHRKMLAFICEPLVQGAGGMLFQHPDWIKHLTRLCAEYGVPMIYDEVFTGYGRLGAPFCFQTLGTAPQILTTSKGLTSGALPFAVTLAHNDIFDAFCSPHAADALLHGHTFTAHPLACGVALKVLEICHQENLFAQGPIMEAFYHTVIASSALSKHPYVRSLRARGTVFAFELCPQKTSSGASSAAAAEQFSGCCQRHGLFIRPLGSTVYLVPPLTSSRSELMQMCSILEQALYESFPLSQKT